MARAPALVYLKNHGRAARATKVHVKPQTISPPVDAPHVAIAPLVVWLMLQGLAIILAALRVPLWLHAPDASESLAIYTLLTIQILASSLLFARLTENRRSTVMTIASVWPFAILAGFLANASIPVIVSSAAFVSAWVFVLALWNSPLTSTQMKLTATSIFAGWCAAGPLLLFLGYEYSVVPLSPPTPSQQIAFGPLLNAYTVANGNDTMSPWLTLVIPGVLALGFIFVKIALRYNRETPSAPLNPAAL